MARALLWARAGVLVAAVAALRGAHGEYSLVRRGVIGANADTPGYWKDAAMSSDGQYMFLANHDCEGCSDGGIFRSTDGGQTWSRSVPGAGWYAVSASASGQYVTAVGWNGFPMYSSDYGATFTASAGPANPTGMGMASSASGAQVVLATHDGGYVYRSVTPV